MSSLSTSTSLAPISLGGYIKENRKLLVPPVNNRLLYKNKLQVMIVGGPNQREDYHLEYGEELFIQLKGAMDLDVIERGEAKRIRIEEGEAFLLPSCVPHSPQRYSDTIGLVLERKRAPDEKDGLIWFIPGSRGRKILYEEFFYCDDLAKQLKPIIERFYASEEYRTKVPSRILKSSSISSIVADESAICPAPIKLRDSAGPFGKSDGKASLDRTVRIFDSEFILLTFEGPVEAELSSDHGEVLLWSPDWSLSGQLDIEVAETAGLKPATVTASHGKVREGSHHRKLVASLSKGDVTVISPCLDHPQFEACDSKDASVVLLSVPKGQVVFAVLNKATVS